MDIIEKIKKIDNELEKRRRNNKILYYNTGKVIHKKQVSFHKCLKRNRWVFGGNRTGKTECGAVETVYLARGIHPYRKNKKNIECWVVSLSTQVQRDVAQKKILNYINPEWITEIGMLSGRKDFAESGIIDYIKIKNVFGGESRIGFKSCDQGREKFQGTSLDFVWFDEEPPYDIYVECKMRVIDKSGEVFGTMTPLKGLSWVYDTIYLNKNNDDEVWYEQMSWEDNPYLDKNEVKALESVLSLEELEARKHGKFVGSGGLVYSEFDESINVIDPFDVPVEWQDNIAIDPGLKNPLSAHWYCVDYDGNIYVVAEHYVEGKSVEYHAEAIKSICKKLCWKTSTNGMYTSLIDSAAGQRTLASSKSVSELFYDNGILVNPKVNKDLFAGINRVKSYIRNSQGVSKLFIFRNCVNLIREIKGYFWGNNDTPVKKDDHALDELRYYIMSRPENKQSEIKRTKIELHKEKLYRKIKRNKYRL